MSISLASFTYLCARLHTMALAFVGPTHFPAMLIAKPPSCERLAQAPASLFADNSTSHSVTLFLSTFRSPCCSQLRSRFFAMTLAFVCFTHLFASFLSMTSAIERISFAPICLTHLCPRYLIGVLAFLRVADFPTRFLTARFSIHRMSLAAHGLAHLLACL